MRFITLAAVKTAVNLCSCMRSNMGELTSLAATAFSMSAHTVGMRSTTRWGLWTTMEILFPPKDGRRLTHE